MEVKTINLDKLKITADPTKILEYVFYIRAQIKLLEDDLKDNEDMVIAVIESCGKPVSMENEDLVGKATVCCSKTYKYSDELNELIAKKKIMETKIKAKQMVEIACGAEVESENKYIRYNVEFK